MKKLDSRASTIELAAPGDRPPSAFCSRANTCRGSRVDPPAATRSLPFVHDSRDTAAEAPEIPAIAPPAKGLDPFVQKGTRS